MTDRTDGIEREDDERFESLSEDELVEVRGDGPGALALTHLVGGVNID